VDNRDTGKLIEPALNAFRGLPHFVVVTTGGTHTDELRRQFAGDNVLIETIWISGRSSRTPGPSYATAGTAA
jgi:hypothetical protein